MVPGMNRMGMNTATRETEIDTTVNATSDAPLTAAAYGAMPSSM